MSNDAFHDREQAFEAKFKHEEELRFKEHAMAAKAFGLWAAEQLGMSGKDAEAYADKALECDVSHDMDVDVIHMVQQDLMSKGVKMSEHQLMNQFSVNLGQAHKKLFS